MKLLLVVAVALLAAVDARSVQLNRAKRGIGFTRQDVGSIGLSGKVLVDGTIVSFADIAHDIVEIGESGIVTKSGKNIQLTRDLHRVKRHIMNDSGILTSWGQALIFKKPFTTIVADGPSGIVFSDGTLLQKPA